MERLESKRGIPGKRLRRILKVLKKIYRNSRHGKITAGPKLFIYINIYSQAKYSQAIYSSPLCLDSGLRDFGRTPSRVTSHIPLFLPLLPPNSTASLAGRHITTERNLPFKFLASQKRPLHQPLVNPSNKHGLDGGVSGGGDLNHTLKTEHRKKMVPLVGKPCCNEHAYSAGRPTRRVQWEGTSPSSRHSGNKTRGVPSHKGTAEVGPPPASRCLARSPPPTA
ncbi:hypothetical protein BDBG_03518 [Blastomyces gilchristii SLH14081]|uniref:Uncharacterized protein n=1 Tax=Blastomyces gilchristii (strain SLH14081) TaxID=559298 RepID=A0A179UHY0_BLAGS|nr:uncharacterized protein BDBG_03518 [Blastomyces gilchristii SLH14081]OAT07460.1 hypothetical protein BDBG_03518 [Blastomyces gilchristii SLH14081]